MDRSIGPDTTSRMRNVSNSGNASVDLVRLSCIANAIAFQVGPHD